MKKLLFLFFFALTSLAYGQRSDGPNFDIADFNKKMETAEWLFYYDMVAWRTSDTVMTEDQKEIERLGNEWFCFQKDDIWHAVYGNYANGTYDLVFHYLVDDKGEVARTDERVDTSMTHRYSRALQTANKQLEKLKDTINLRFNQYIRENDDKTLTVWIFPAFQPNSVAVYGGEFIYTIDVGGTKILKDDSYYQGQFRGFDVGEPREIWLNYEELDKPSLGGIFFVWYYKSYFTRIVLDTKLSKSTLFKHEDDKSYYWVHAEKEPEKEKKKR
jgi:hypothetical protein